MTFATGVLFNKHSLASGYDAKKMTEEIVKALAH